MPVVWDAPAKTPRVQQPLGAAFESVRRCAWSATPPAIAAELLDRNLPKLRIDDEE
jgi:hypothetical protein